MLSLNPGFINIQTPLMGAKTIVQTAKKDISTEQPNISCLYMLFIPPRTYSCLCQDKQIVKSHSHFNLNIGNIALRFRCRAICSRFLGSHAIYVQTPLRWNGVLVKLRYTSGQWRWRLTIKETVGEF